MSLKNIFGESCKFGSYSVDKVSKNFGGPQILQNHQRKLTFTRGAQVLNFP